VKAEKALEDDDDNDDDDDQGCKFFAAKNRKMCSPIAAKNPKFAKNSRLQL